MPYLLILAKRIIWLMKKTITILLCISTVVSSCGQTANRTGDKDIEDPGITSAGYINSEGNTISTRFNLPYGYERVPGDENSFGSYFGNLPLKAHGSKVMLYNGDPKFNQAAHVAVLDMDVGKYNLQQCADAIMRLRAEYLYQNKQYDRIHFNFTNGFRVDYSKWIEGNRIVVKGNKSNWVKSAEPSNTYSDFRDYLKIIFTYAGSLSLSKELVKVEYSDMMTGDIFIQGGSPGHAVIVVDMAVNNSTGAKIFILAQSYMPAQEIHVLVNPQNSGSPWYNLDVNDNIIETPEWTFYPGDLKRFPEEL